MEKEIYFLIRNIYIYTIVNGIGYSQFNGQMISRLDFRFKNNGEIQWNKQ